MSGSHRFLVASAASAETFEGAPSQYNMACADAEERAEVAFELLDVDGDGVLGKEDIRQALTLCGYEAEAGTLELLAAMTEAYSLGYTILADAEITWGADHRREGCDNPAAPSHLGVGQGGRQHDDRSLSRDEDQAPSNKNCADGCFAAWGLSSLWVFQASRSQHLVHPL
ncbi:hypothetical protein AK812_SmicGene32941 [Symbiodinium microadriaticum]|uniref:EF-hand domain-containing protein n=1 Tax=Symbiodinium microadriaticum TaxID=2951 RepID=A0A1Q9CSU2_SYMMI|nr:hypothetical protein AK812_SmicGene32941 [Symbiodinium microadriaticum]